MTIPKPTAPPNHAENKIFPIVDGQILIGNIPLTQLVHRVGQTPFYAYDRRAITQRVEHLRQHMPSDLKIHYAMKANPMPALVQHMATLVDGFDLASAGEMKVALDTTMPTEQISFAGPGKRPEELSQAIAAGVTLNIESQHELETIAHQCEKLGLNAKVAVRINPAFELKASGMKMGGGPKQFGIDEEQVPAVLHRIKDLGLNLQGLHIYSGSQNLKAEAIIEAQQNCLTLAEDLITHCNDSILKLNIGGGYGIPYFPGDKPLNIKQIGDALNENMKNFKVKSPNTEIIIELGRYIVGEAGVYICKVIDKKTSRGQIYLIVDGGLNHHLAASGNFGQVIRKNYPIIVGNKINRYPLETVNIVGPLCTPLDVLADKVELPEANIGDYIVIHQSGAYGLSASPTAFLSQPRAEEVLV